MRQEVRLSGSGAGLLLIGGTLAEALVLSKGKRGAEQFHGGQVRGGSSRSDVLIAPPGEEIDYPESWMPTSPGDDAEALDEYRPSQTEGSGRSDTTNVKQIPEMKSEIVSYPFTLKTKERLGTSSPRTWWSAVIVA